MSLLLPEPSELQGNRIAIFGLSANPPTGLTGHTGILKYLKSLQIFDEIWILPVYQHIFNSKRIMEPYEHRINMCKLCVEVINHDIDIETTTTHQCNIRVLTLEKIVNEYHFQLDENYRVGTIDVLEYVNRKYENLQINLVLGLDTFNDYSSMKWKQANKINELIHTLHVITRKGTSIHQEYFDNNPKCKLHELLFLEELSSSNICELIYTYNNEQQEQQEEGRGTSSLLELKQKLTLYLSSSVVNYIIDNQLYGIKL